MKNYYKRYLPHLTPAGGIFFITSTLKDSLPKTVIQDLKAEKVAILKSLKTAQHLELSDTAYQTELINTHKRHFAKIDRLLDTTKEGKHYLKNPAAAQILADKFHKYEGEYYRLEAYTIMSNHFHLLIDTSIQLERLPESVEANDSNYTSLSTIMNLIKGGSSYAINRHLGRSGALWQIESYDHLVRDDAERIAICFYL